MFIREGELWVDRGGVELNDKKGTVLSYKCGSDKVCLRGFLNAACGDTSRVYGRQGMENLSDNRKLSKNVLNCLRAGLS